MYSRLCVCKYVALFQSHWLLVAQFSFLGRLKDQFLHFDDFQIGWGVIWAKPIYIVWKLSLQQKLRNFALILLYFVDLCENRVCSQTNPQNEATDRCIKIIWTAIGKEGMGLQRH